MIKIRAFVSVNFNIDKVLAQTGTATDNADFNNFFLNSMDAVDRFVSLFILDPNKYTLYSSTPTPTPLNIFNLRSLLQNFTNIFDYNNLVGNYGK